MVAVRRRDPNGGRERKGRRDVVYEGTANRPPYFVHTLESKIYMLIPCIPVYTNEAKEKKKHPNKKDIDKTDDKEPSILSQEEMHPRTK